MTTQTGEAGLDPAVRDAVRDLILVLADSKRLLGFRYAEWMLGAPELETSIACSSMAQDEWGHARLLYALLKEFDDDVEALEHGRDASEYRNMSVLDEPTENWPDVVAIMVVADLAISLQFEALSESTHTPLEQRVEKVLEEERFHAAHGAAWFRRLAGGTAASKAAITEAVERTMDPVLAWFGPDSERLDALRSAGVVSAGGSELRRRLVERVAPLLELVGLDDRYADYHPELADYDEARRRVDGGGPDEETIRKARGDRNRAFLMD